MKPVAPHRPSRPRLAPIPGILVLALLATAPHHAHALFNLGGTQTQIFVTGRATLAYDSNIFAESTERGDYIFTAGAGIEFKRRAGIFAIDARAAFDYSRFDRYTDQDAWNPSFFLEVNKASGRTTGALTVNAFRESRADSSVNFRTQSWNFPVSLNLKYPVSDRFYLSSQTAVLQRSYQRDALLLDYTDFSQGLNLFYVYTSKLDLFGGYRVRLGRTDLGRTVDHAVNFGATGGLLPKVNGTLSVAFQRRDIDYSGETFDAVGVAASLQWTATRKFTATAGVARDFNTTATGTSVDTFSGQLRGTYVFTRRFSVEGGVAVGRNRFLGGGITYRHDTFFSADLGATYTVNEHLRLSASHSLSRNWSSIDFADYVRRGYTLEASVRF